ncbi:MAG: hypothetical protein M3Q60_14460 [Actinomycetota bacterium]|jgi:hypothetical protein|nr:hypothetical protein [Actinomycetota bacterium]
MGGRRGKFSFLREEFNDLGGDAGREPRREPQGGAGEPDPAGGAEERVAPVAGALGAGREEGRPSGGGPRRRQRRRDPNALRNDPNRKLMGAYVRKDVKRGVDRALEDERLFPDGRGSLSLLVEGLLERWLDESGYGVGEGR